MLKKSNATKLRSVANAKNMEADFTCVVSKLRTRSNQTGILVPMAMQYVRALVAFRIDCIFLCANGDWWHARPIGAARLLAQCCLHRHVRGVAGVAANCFDKTLKRRQRFWRVNEVIGSVRPARALVLGATGGMQPSA